MAIAVIAGAAWFMVYGLRVDTPTVGGTMTLSAVYRQVDGLKVGDPVRVAGIEVGRVTAVGIDPKTLAVRISFTVSKSLTIYSDAVAAVMTPGLFGGKVLQLDPGGGADTTLTDGGMVTLVQDAVLVDELVEKIVQFGEEKRAKARATAPSGN